MKISACVIVKNEEKNIARWLANMQQIADEIIVVDTGSTDSTLAILGQAGIKPYHFAWCNDFAAAKNYAIQQATGDWIVFLDADEYFDAKSVQCFRAEMARYHRNKKMGAIMCQLVNIDTDNRNKIISTMIQVRIFRNSKYIRYKNPVHEQLVAEPGKYIMQKNFSLQIMHTGYSASIVRAKAERNLPILKQKEKLASSQHEKGEIYLFLMDAYNCLGDYENVRKYAKKAIEAKAEILGNAIHPYSLLIASMITLGMDERDIINEIEKAKDKFPQEPFLLIQQGHYSYIRGDLLSAENYLLKALSLRKELEKQISKGEIIIDNSRNALPVLYSCLGDIYIRRGAKQRALEIALEGMEYYKYNSLLTRALYKSLLGRPVVEIIQIFDCFYDRQKDGDFLKETLGWQVAGEFAAYYYASDSQMDRTKMYLKVGKYQGGTAAAGEQLALLQHAALSAALAQHKAGREKIIDAFGILPPKYRKMAQSLASCQQYEDGRAAVRLGKQLKHYG